MVSPSSSSSSSPLSQLDRLHLPTNRQDLEGSYKTSYTTSDSSVRAKASSSSPSSSSAQVLPSSLPPASPPPYHSSAPSSVSFRGRPSHCHSYSESSATIVAASFRDDDDSIVRSTAPNFCNPIAEGHTRDLTTHQRHHLAHPQSYLLNSQSAMSQTSPYQDYSLPLQDASGGRVGHVGLHAGLYNPSVDLGPPQPYESLSDAGQVNQQYFSSPWSQNHIQLQPIQHAYRQHQHVQSVPSHIAGMDDGGQLAAAVQRHYAANVNPEGSAGKAPVVGSNDARLAMRYANGFTANHASPALSYSSLPASPHSNNTAPLGPNFGRLPNGSIIELFPAMMRTLQACEYCRSRKAKCTGGLPCERCTKKGVRCEYAQLDKKRKVKTTTSRLDLSGVSQSTSQQQQQQQHYHLQEQQAQHQNGPEKSATSSAGYRNTCDGALKRSASQMSSCDYATPDKKRIKAERTSTDAHLLLSMSHHTSDDQGDASFSKEEEAAVKVPDQLSHKATIEHRPSLSSSGFKVMSQPLGDSYAYGAPSSVRSLPLPTSELALGTMPYSSNYFERSAALLHEEQATPSSYPCSPNPNADSIGPSAGHRASSSHSRFNDGLPLLWQDIHAMSSQASTSSTVSHPPSPKGGALAWAPDSLSPSPLLHLAAAPCLTSPSPGLSPRTLPRRLHPI